MNKSLSDKPSKDDLFGRSAYVDVIFESITSSDENFNLAISAQWGEGKSTILEQLEPKLIAQGYKVLKFNPWKYTQDIISLKRKFLIDVYSQLGLSLNETNLYSQQENNVSISTSKQIVEVLKTFKSYTLYFIAASVVIFLPLVLVKLYLKQDLDLFKYVSNLLILPTITGLFPFLQKISEIKVKQISPKIESAEQFEKLFNDAIKKVLKKKSLFKQDRKKVIIFIDDLDRCNQHEVEQVLTALFTFFNNEHCSYVITADHTVIKDYVGNLLVPKGSPADQNLKATEYLKKIFQINFILPKIPSSVLKPWVEELVKDLKFNFNDKKLGLSNLVDLISLNLNGNPRKIKHLIRTLDFQLKVIQKKVDADQEGILADELRIILGYPELLSKVLIIQDLASAEFEEISKKPKTLKELENSREMSDLKLQQLFRQEPKFYSSKTRKIEGDIDPTLFVFESGTTGFEEIDVHSFESYVLSSKSLDYKVIDRMANNNTDKANLILIRELLAYLADSKTNETNLLKTIFHLMAKIVDQKYFEELIGEMLDITIERHPQSPSEIPALTKEDFDKIIHKLDVANLGRIFDPSSPYVQLPSKILIYDSYSSVLNKDNQESYNWFVDKITEQAFGTLSNFSTFFAYFGKMGRGVLDNEKFTSEVVSKFSSLTYDQQRQVILFVCEDVLTNTTLKQFFGEEVKRLLTDVNTDKNVFVINLVLQGLFNLISEQEFTDLVISRMSTIDGPHLSTYVDNLLSRQILSQIKPNNEIRIRKSFIDLLNSGNPKRDFAAAKLSVLVDLPDSLKLENRNMFIPLLPFINAKADSTEEIIARELSKNKEKWVLKKDKKQIEKEIDGILLKNVNPTVTTSLSEIKGYLNTL